VKKIFLIVAAVVLVTFSALQARDNPFVPTVDMQNLPVTSSDPVIKEQLSEFEFKMPNGAQIVNAIVIKYQDASGETKSAEFEVDKKIRWHYPLYLSHTPKKHYEKKEYEPLDFLKIVHEGTSLYIYTKQKMLRTFHLTEPFKLVFDFENTASFLTKRETMDKPLDSYAVGDHGDYFRVVLEFDATYRYGYEEFNGGVKIELK
jgi:hypothetical protein